MPKSSGKGKGAPAPAAGGGRTAGKRKAAIKAEQSLAGGDQPRLRADRVVSNPPPTPIPIPAPTLLPHPAISRPPRPAAAARPRTGTLPPPRSHSARATAGGLRPAPHPAGARGPRADHHLPAGGLKKASLRRPLFPARAS